MERLTYWCDNGHGGGKWFVAIDAEGGEDYGPHVDRLAAYEDILGEEYDLDRLRELAQADREGRCVVLPVKLHDKLYYVDKEQVRETEVESIHNWTSGRWKLSTHTDRQSTHWIGYEVDFDGIGKTVFLTREEAEAALRREQGKEGRP